jgi:hypothetical protein
MTLVTHAWQALSRVIWGMRNREAASNLLQLLLVHGTKHNLGMYTYLIGLNFDFLQLGFFTLRGRNELSTGPRILGHRDVSKSPYDGRLPVKNGLY